MFTADKNMFDCAVQLYRDWNEKINVVSRKDIDMLYEHHILHSLAIAAYMDRCGLDPAGKSVLDVGTGGGFPGIPLSMVWPDSRFTLCDSIGKKILVASEVASALGLGNVRCVNARAESLGEKYDIVVTRAVTTLDKFYPWVKNSFRERILALKGGDVLDEVAVFCARCKVDPSKVSVWRISDWLEDEYFAEKFVIEIRK